MINIRIFFILFLSFFYTQVSAQVDPSAKWSTLTETHAIWIYDSRHKELAYQYAKNFRRMFPQLKAMFKEFPEKTTFVIVDQTDMPNGSATVFPYPLVTIFPVIPVPNSPIGETDDSLFEILAHEYTHILNLNPVHGGMKPLSWIFGSIIRPNSYLPRWYSEGLAVFAETYYMPRGGRLRSQNFEGMVRAFHLDNSWSNLSIDQLNDFQPDWLGGRRAYLLGGALFFELVDKKNIDPIYTLNQRYSRRMPYFINGPLEDEIDKSYSELLSNTYAHLTELAQKQLAPVQASKVTVGTKLAIQGFDNYHPIFSPDGRYLAFVSRDHNVPGSILLQDNVNADYSKEPHRIAFGIDILHLAWSPDSKILAYNSIQRFKRFYTYSEIHLYDVEKKTTTKLTKGGRTGSMAFTADGKKIIFAQNTPGSKRISEVSLDTKAVRVLYDPKKIGTNIFGITVQGNDVAFVEQFSEKHELKLLNLADLSLKTLNQNITVSRIQKTSKGLLVASTKSGIDNLYLLPELKDAADLGNAKSITNSATRILDGDINPVNGSLVYSEQTGSGVLIKHIPESEWANAAPTPKVEPLLNIPTPKMVETSTQEDPLAEGSYSPWGYMIPRYWMPFGAALDGGVSLQASTGSVDPIGNHAYSLAAEWDSLTKQTGGTLSYSNNTTPLGLNFSANQVYRYSYTNQAILKDTGAAISATYDIPFMFKSWDLSLGWRHSNTDFVNSTIERSGPTAVIGYNSAIQRGYEISPESGSAFSLSNQAYIEDLGNIGYNKTNLSARHYFSSSWMPSRHVLFSQINATYAPELNSTALFTSTLNGSFASNLLIPPFLVRGYPSGNILGNNMAVANLEYRFPIWYIYKGIGTVPLYFRTLHGAVIGDVVGLDGFRWSEARNGFLRSRFGDDFFVGYGVEFHLETTIGYFLPVKFSFGAFRGGTPDLTNEDVSYFFAFVF
jgi:hypothetical protein